MQTNQVVRLKTQSAVEPVTEIDVTRILNLRESKAFLKKRLEQVDSDLGAAEDELIARIESGAPILSSHMVSIKANERRSPSWKDAYITLVGEQEAKKIIESTTPHISKSLVIALK